MTADGAASKFFEAYGHEPFFKIFSRLKAGFIGELEASTSTVEKIAEPAFCRAFAYDLIIKSILNDELSDLGLSPFSGDIFIPAAQSLSAEERFELYRFLNEMYIQPFERWYVGIKAYYGIVSTTKISGIDEADSLLVEYGFSVSGLAMSIAVSDIDTIDYDWDEEPYISGIEASEEVGIYTGNYIDKDKAYDIVCATKERILETSPSTVMPQSLLFKDVQRLLLCAKDD